MMLLEYDFPTPRWAFLRLQMKEHADAEYRDSFGIIVICMHCRRTRRNTSDGHEWVLVVEYLATRPNGVSDGLCPECLEKHYPAE